MSRGEIRSRPGSADGPTAGPAHRSSVGSPELSAWLTWVVAVLAYVVAVFHRASLGVAGIEAQHRFGTTAAVLSLFGVLQLAVYAAMQVPVGVLLDRFGSRRMILVGALVMAVGQLALATATGVPAALGARVLVGAGDAMTFISVLRLLPAWFAPRQVPMVTQLTGILGQLGQLAAAYPLVAALRSLGWPLTFGAVAGLGVAVAMLVAVVLRDAPAPTTQAPPAAAPGPRWREIAASWREPGTRLGFWTHFVTQFSGTTFGLFWGYPFLVGAEGLSPATASLLLSVLVVGAMAVGPVLGRLVVRWPLRRSVLVIGIVGTSTAAWSLVLGWPGRAPLPVLVALVVVLATNGPGAMIGFDYARTSNSAVRLGSASGLVNVGGFVASLVTILAVGVLLDRLTPGGTASYPLDAFKPALAVQYLVWTVGLVGVLSTRRVLRRRLAADGVVLDPVHRAVIRRLRLALQP